jgi:hypothetical protein
MSQTLKQRAQVIQRETIANANTASRVGGLLSDMTDAYAGRNDTGWVQYNDTQYTVASPFTVTEGSKVTMPMNSGNVIATYIPSDTTHLYSNVSNKITPTNIGDAYVVAIRFRAKNSMNFGGLTVGIDIGGALNTFVEQSLPFIRNANLEQYFNIVFSIFTLDTFVANGGTVKITAVQGNLQIYQIRYVITRVFKAT